MSRSVAAFFLGLAVLGLWLHRDYGISWDEPLVVAYGEAMWDFLSQGAQGELVGRARFHGSLVPLAWVGLEKLELFGDPRPLFFFRHLLNYALFVLGVAGFYALCRRGFASRRWALLGALFLVLSPRHFAHAFYNPKDIPFMAVFCWAIYTGVRFVEAPRWRSALLHAGVSAVAANFRLVGLLAPLLSITLLLLRLGPPAARALPWRRALGLGAACALATWLAFVALFPSLWSRPLSGTLEAITHLSRFPLRVELLYLGETLASDDLPWHYPLVWMAITIPPLYLLLFAIGAPAFALGARPRRAWLERSWVDLLVLAWLLLPLGGVLALDSVLFDDWRHLYFVYPALLWFSLRGTRELLGRVGPGVGRVLLGTGLGLALLANALEIARHHPHQGVYFNRLAGDAERIPERFDLDYWGVSYRQGLEALCAGDPRQRIPVRVANAPGLRNRLILPRRDRERLHFVEKWEDADYFVTNYRWAQDRPSLGAPLHSVVVRGIRILGVYDLRAGGERPGASRMMLEPPKRRSAIPVSAPR